MKTYKTWEAIKMLAENPKLKFKCCRATMQCTGGYLDGTFGAVRGINGNIPMSGEWSLVQQPVRFIEAVNAYDKGKSIYCQLKDEKYFYIPNDDTKCGRTGYVLTDNGGSAVSTGEIFHGTWYIGEPEE